jgi:hypothetical protein
MNINITIVPHKEQRYETVGDWQFDDFGNLSILVSNLGDDRENCLIAIHELIEAILCKFATPEVTTEMVDKFDVEHKDLDDPGADPSAPYHTQHRAAEMIEFQLASKLHVGWYEYDKKVKNL